MFWSTVTSRPMFGCDILHGVNGKQREENLALSGRQARGQGLISSNQI